MLKQRVRSGILVLAVVCGHAVHAQDAPASPFSSVHLSGGGFFTGDQALFRQDVARLTPGSTLLAGGLPDHDYDSDPYMDEGAALFEAGIGLLPFRKAERSGPELRLGLLYAGRNALAGSFSRITRTPYDTLTSSQTGEVYFVDSVYRSTYVVQHSAERFGLSASLIWRTKGRWSILGGAGLAGGLLMNARTEVFRSMFASVDGPSSGPNDGFYGRYNNGAWESFRNGTGWWVSLYTPIGLDFRIARKGEFWSRMHLYTELRPQLLFQGTPELGTVTSFGLQQVFGVRYTP